MIPSANATVKAAYPRKQVRTCDVSQLLCSAGISGSMRLLTPGAMEAYAMIRNATGKTKTPILRFLRRHSMSRYKRTIVQAKKISDS